MAAYMHVDVKRVAIMKQCLIMLMEVICNLNINQIQILIKCFMSSRSPTLIMVALIGQISQMNFITNYRFFIITCLYSSWYQNANYWNDGCSCVGLKLDKQWYNQLLQIFFPCLRKLGPSYICPLNFELIVKCKKPISLLDGSHAA